MDKARSYLPTPGKIGVHGGTAMKATTINSPSFLKAPVHSRRLENFARRMVRSRLRKLRNGQVTIKEGDSVVVYGGQTDACQLTAVLHVGHPAFYGDIAFGGSIGAGEAYMQGHWRCDNLSDLLRILLINRDVLEDID